MTEEEKSRIPFPTAQKKSFYGKYHHLTDSEVLKELLYSNHLKVDKLEKIRSNVSKLVWWLVAVPLLFGLLFFFFSLQA